MTDHRFTDTAPMSGARITADGYLVAEVRCARTGCQDYLASDFGLDGGGTISVYRPEDVVFDKASMATFAGKPVTMGHPAEPVTADNWKALAVGDIGMEVARDGDYVRVPIKLMDASAVSAVQAGTRQLSMGYTTGMEMRDGVAPDGTAYRAVQTGPIRINHLAIVPQARGGSNLRIGDGADQWGATPIINGKDADMPDGIKTRTVMIDGLSVETTDAGAQALEKLTRDAADAKAASDKVIAAKDAELATKDATIADLKAKVLDAGALDKLVSDRADLIARAKTLHDAEYSGKSLADIRKAVVLAKRGVAVADKSDAYFEAAFDLLAADAKVDDPAAKALGDMAGKKAVDDREKVYSDRSKSLSDAWKTQPKKEGV